MTARATFTLTGAPVPPLERASVFSDEQGSGPGITSLGSPGGRGMSQ
jgi:hypothetical protein